MGLLLCWPFAKEFTFKGRQTAMQCMHIVGNLYSRGQLGAAKTILQMFYCIPRTLSGVSRAEAVASDLLRALKKIFKNVKVESAG